MIIGDIEISKCQELKTFAGLEALSQLTGSLSITHNTDLQSISALGQLESISGDLFILFNPKLSKCSVMAVCNKITAGGYYNIGANLNECHSASAIIEGCSVGIGEPWKENDVVLYPNPTSHLVEVTGIDFTNTRIMVSDSQGRSVKNVTFQYHTLDLTNLPDGIYFISLHTNHNTITKRVFKI